MAELCRMIRSVPVHRLDWNGKTRTFTAELSELSGFALERVYPDACDVGMTLCNPKTGNEVVFYLSKEDRDGEGDLRFYEFLPTSESVRKHPGMNGVKVILFND